MEQMKRLLSFVLALVMVFSLAPVQVLAEEVTPEQTNTATELTEDEPVDEPASEPVDELTSELIGELEGKTDATESMSETGVELIDKSDFAYGIDVISDREGNEISVTYMDPGLMAYYDQYGHTYSRKNSTSDTITDVITLSNNTAEYNISFQYTTRDTNQAMIGTGVVAASGQYTLLAGETVQVSLEIATNKTGGFMMSTFTYAKKAEEKQEINFAYSPLGTVKVGGTTVAEGGYTKSFEKDEKVTIIATPNDGVNFLGWVDADTGRVISPNATYEMEAEDGLSQVKAAFAKADATAWFRVGGYLFDDLDAAVTYAQTPKQNDTIVLAASGTLAAKTDAEGNAVPYVIPTGEKLLIPHSEGDSGNFGEKPGKSEAEPGTTQKAHVTLTLADGAVIDCYGMLNVNGRIYNKNGWDTGVPTDTYGKIHLAGTNAKINIGTDVSGNKGTLYCYGYITGTGVVTADSGASVYEIFQMTGWRSGGEAYAWHYSSNKASFLLNDYAVQNIEADYVVKAGATSYVVAAVSADTKIFGVQTNFSTATYIGTSSGLIQLGASGSVKRSFTSATNRMQYTLYGKTVTVAGISLNIDAIIVDIDLDSTQHILAISQHMDFVAAPESKVTLKNKYKLMPGATLTVSKGAHAVMESTSELYIYDAKDYVGQNYGRTDAARYVASSGAYSGIPTMNASTHSAQVVVNGTLEVNGKIYTTSNGGTSADKVIKGTGTIQFNSVAGDVVKTLQEYTYSGDGYNTQQTVYEITCVPAAAQVMGLSVGDNSHSLVAGTYHGTANGQWYQYVITADNSQFVEKVRPAADAAMTGVNGTIGVAGSGRAITYTDGKATGLQTVAHSTFRFGLDADVTSVTRSDNNAVLEPSNTGVYTLTGLTEDVALTIVASEKTNKSEAADYNGKIISILGDGASAFAGTIPVADSFNKNHASYYPQGDVSAAEDMWWNQLIAQLGAKLGVNDSWSGTQVTGTDAAAMASLTRIQNLGSNGTPDVIVFFGGATDIQNRVRLTQFTSATLDLNATSWSSFTDAYAAAILRLKHYYPNSHIIAVLPNYAPASYSNSLVDDYCTVMQDICDYYGIFTVDLRQKVEGIYPDAAGMDAITVEVLDCLLGNHTMIAGENVTYSIAHQLTNAKASNSHYRKLSRGTSFTETVTGKNMTVTVTMGGTDITADAYKDGVITISNVTGAVEITVNATFDYTTYLQQLPTPAYESTNLWAALTPDQGYYGSTGWTTTVSSITIPVNPGDKIAATSFGTYPGNHGTQNGIRITWFQTDGTPATVDPSDVYSEYSKWGYVTAPENAVAVNIPMWGEYADNAVYNLSLPILYHSLYASYLQPIPEDATSSTNIWTALPRRDAVYFNGTSYGTNQNVHSITIPVEPGDQILTKSMQESDIRLTWFSRDGVLSTGTHTKSDRPVVAPDGAVAVCLSSWSRDDEVYILSLPAGEDYVKDESKYNTHLQQLPDDVWCTTNLWLALEPRNERYTGTTWENNFWSITIPVSYGDRITATSFGARDVNDSSLANYNMDGIRLIWFKDNGEIINVDPGDVYAEYKEKGYVEAPKGVSAVCVTLWANVPGKSEVKLLTLPDRPANAVDDSQFEDYLQPIPENAYNTTNLWAALERKDNVYFSGSYYGVNGGYPNVRSVTIPVSAGAKIVANSFRAKNDNDNANNDGIRVTWFFKDGTYSSVGGSVVYNEFSQKGYLTAPANTVAVCIPVWEWESAKNEIYLLNLPTDPNYTGHLQPLPEKAYDITNLWPLLKKETVYYNGSTYGTNGAVVSVTIPVSGGNRLASNAFGAKGTNGNAVNDGIRITWFFEDGRAPLSYSAAEIFTQYTENGGYIVAPEGAIAVCVPQWQESNSNWLRNLSLPKDTDYRNHLQSLPENFDSTTNLWPLLRKETVYYGGQHYTEIGNVVSVTVPVTGGQRVASNAFHRVKYNHNNYNNISGIRITWFFDDGTAPKSIAPKEVYKEFSANNGYITAPENAVAVCLAQWQEHKDNYLYILPPATEAPLIGTGHTLYNHIQILPDVLCSGINLWTELDRNHDSKYYTSSGWGTHNTARSVTFRVNPGDQIYATSFEAGSAIRIAYFRLNQSPESIGGDVVKQEFNANKVAVGKGYITVPEDVYAVSIPMWDNENTNELYILNRNHVYVNGVCTGCGEKDYTNLASYQGKVISVMGDSISTFAGWIPTADGYNLEHLPRYPQDGTEGNGPYLLTDVNETWWKQVVDQLNAKLGINESWRGATLSGNKPVTSGTTGANAAMSNLTRIQNMGSNGTPDVILLYGGTNDLAHVTKVGSFDAANAPTLENVNLTTKSWDNLADGFVHTLLRMRYFYPDALIVAMLPTYTIGYYSDEKLNEGNAVMIQICEHYDIPYVDLRNCGIEATTEYLPDNIHPGETGMDLITAAVLDVLNEQTIQAGVHNVHKVTHQLSGAKATLGHYKGIDANAQFVETLTGKNMTVTVSMGGADITASAYNAQTGTITIEEVTGELVITATGAGNQLPTNLCGGLNLWAMMDHDDGYYTATGWGQHALGTVTSVTFPVNAGDRIYASSFEASSINGSEEGNGTAINSIRIALFDAAGNFTTVPADQVWEQFSQNGYYTVPEGMVKISVPMWTISDEWELYILNRSHNYQNGVCSICQKNSLFSGKIISIMGDSISTMETMIPEADGFNLKHRTRYVLTEKSDKSLLVMDPNETWWMQTINALGAKLGINDSWAGSRVNNEQNTNSGDLGPDAAMASLTRIQNLGANGTPDVILVFGGTNDRHGSDVGKFEDITPPTVENVDLSSKKWSTFAEAYATMITRMQHYYPDAEIMVLLTYTNDTDGKAINAEIVKICDHYGIPYSDTSTLGVMSNTADGLHPNETGMDLISTQLVSDILKKVDIEAGEHNVYTVRHELSDVTASLGHWKGIDANAKFEETLTFEDTANVVVTMNNEDITATAYDEQTKKITIDSVTGNVVITAEAIEKELTFAERVQLLPVNVYKDTNLWTVLTPNPDHYSANAVWEGPYSSITFPVVPGEHIWSTSFGAGSVNGNGSTNGIRVTWFDDEYNVLESWGPTVVYPKFQENGCLIVPDGAAYVNVPAWNNENNVVKIISRPTIYDGHLIADMPENICAGTNIWDLLKTGWKTDYMTGDGAWDINTAAPNLRSITIPISAGDVIYSTAFGEAGTNGNATQAGIRITWFDEDGILESAYISESNNNLAADGTVTAPAGAVAVNLPVWDYEADNEMYIRSLTHSYGEPKWEWTVNAETGSIAAKAVFTCGTCGDIVNVAAPSVTEKSRVDATCVTEGSVIYTASVVFENNTYTGDSEIITIPALNHSGAADAAWQHDGTNHWKVCPDCKENVNTDAHNYVDGTCDRCGDKNENVQTDPIVVDPDVMKAFLTLEAEVFLNVAFELDNIGDTDPKTLVNRVGLLMWDADSAPELSSATIENCSKVLTSITYNEETGRYQARTKGIAAKNLGDEIAVRAYYLSEDGEYRYGKYITRYSPKTYCERQLKDADTSDDALMIALLNYCATAQDYFKHHNGYTFATYINSGLTDTQKQLVWNENLVRSEWAVPAEKEGSLSRNREIISKRSTYLSLEGAIDYNFVIGVSNANVAKAEILVWTAEQYNAQSVLDEGSAAVYDMEYKADKQQYEFKYKGLAAKRMFVPVYTCARITDTDGNVYYGGVLAYCPERFAYVNLTSTTVAAIDVELAKRLVIYGDAARTYFGG